MTDSRSKNEIDYEGEESLRDAIPRGEGGDVQDNATTDVLSADDVYTTLSNRRRRYVLDHLKKSKGPVSLRELSESVACRENGITPVELTRQQRKRVYTALHQTHLPKMDDLGIVRYDRHRTTVELSDEMRGVDVYLEIVPTGHFTWSQYYVLLAGLVGALTLALQEHLLPVWFDGILLSWFTVALFGLSAVVHYVQSRSIRIGTDDPPI